MIIRQLKRSSAVAWSPGAHNPYLAAGTVAGAFDLSMNPATELEIYDMNFDELSSGNTIKMSEAKRIGVVPSTARFNRLGWGNIGGDVSRPYGIIAGGMENGELDLWDATAIIQGRSKESLLMKNGSHSGPVKGLDFNPVQSNLLATGASDGEIFVWDLNNPSKPYSPGTRSQRLEDVTCIAWNRQVAYILASGSNNGSTVIWDLRNRKELFPLAHPGGRKMITGVAWNPSVPTQFVTVADDDYNPVILMWDLRNARAPEKTISGHTKGILSVSWCPKDSDLLISSGKDNRALCWNPTTGEMVGDIQTSSNWAFDIQWSSRNPDLVAISSYDCRVSVHSLQGAKGVTVENDVSSSDVPNMTSVPDDPFMAAIQGSMAMQAAPTSSNFTLPHPPKWMRRPCSAVWGFGGRIVSFTNAAVPGQPNRRTVSLRVPVPEPELYTRISALESILSANIPDQFTQYCDSMKSLHERKARELGETHGGPDMMREKDSWAFLGAMFSKDAREKVLEFLGFKSGKVDDSQILALVSKLKLDDPAALDTSVNGSMNNLAGTKSPSVAALNGVAPSLEASGILGGNELTVPGSPEKAVGAKSPSRPFSLYPTSKESTDPETDSMITKCLLVGDFETGVKVCLSKDRFSDAMMLAYCGGEELVSIVQREYFKRHRTKKNYARLLESIVKRSVEDVVSNASLGLDGAHWKDVLAFICTYAKSDEFQSTCGQLGARLEELLASRQRTSAAVTASNVSSLDEIRFAASLCYLGAGSLEKLVDIWISKEDLLERKTVESGKTKKHGHLSTYGVHALSLQDLVEKVTVFIQSIGFVDPDLTVGPTYDEAGNAVMPEYKLQKLYEKYAEYADLVASYGRPDIAARFLAYLPVGFQWKSRPAAVDGMDSVVVLKHRIYQHAASKVGHLFANTGVPASPFTVENVVFHQPAPVYEEDSMPLSYFAQQQSYPYGNANPYGAQQQQQQNPYGSSSQLYNPYGSSTQPYASSTATHQSYNPYGQSTQPQQQQQPSYGAPQYGSTNSAYGRPPAATAASPAAPPPRTDYSSGSSAYSNPYASSYTNPAVPLTSSTSTQSLSGGGFGGFDSSTSEPPKRPSFAVPPPPPVIGGGAGGQAGNSALPPPPPSAMNAPPKTGFNDPPPMNMAPNRLMPANQPSSLPPPPPASSQSFGAPPRMGGPGASPAQPPLGPPPTTASWSQPTPPPPQQQQQHQQPPPPSYGAPPTQATLPPPPKVPIPAPPSSYGAPPTQQQSYGAPPQTAPYQQQPPQASPYQQPQQLAPPPQQQQQQQQQPKPYGMPPQASPNPGFGAPPPAASMNSPTSAGLPPRMSLTTPGLPSPQGMPPMNRPAAAPEKPRHAPGDRSHILPQHKPVTDGLMRAFDAIRQSSNPAIHGKMIEDTEKRLNLFLDAVNNQDLPAAIMDKMAVLVRGMETRDFTTSHKIVLELMTTKMDVAGHWIVGVKRLVESVEKLVKTGSI